MTDLAPEQTCIDCGKSTAVNGLGRCGDCQVWFDQIKSDLTHEEVPIDELVARIKAANGVDEIMDALAAARPPFDKLEQQAAREKLLRALRNRVSSPAKIVDAWLGSRPDDEKDQAAFARQASVLVKLVQDRDATLFHTPDHTAYVALIVEGHREVLSLRSRQFRLWLARAYWQHTEEEIERAKSLLEKPDVTLGDLINLTDQKAPSVPGTQALTDAIAALEGMAIFGGDEFDVHVRVARLDNKTYLDLGNEKWEAVEVDAHGWRVVSRPPVMFRRPNGLKPLPHPEPGKIETLRPFLNVSDRDWPLTIGFVVGLFSAGPYPVLVFLGEQGTAKSTSTKVIRRIVDPSSAALRRKPRNDHDLAIAANNGWVITVDNISSMPVWLSDAICTLATGGGFATRQLYSDADEQLFDSMRPVILNGIGAIAVRSDLLDRAVLIDLEPINTKIAEEKFWDDFDLALPGILGAVLTAVSTALANVADVVLKQTPRMVDFARWVTAAEPALGLQDGSFLTSYLGNRAMADETALDATPVGRFIRDLAELEPWEGTATDLLSRLNVMANMSDGVYEPGHNGSTVRQEDWPKGANALSNRLKLIAPNLRRVGIQVTFGRDKSSRHISIASTSHNVGKGPSSPSPGGHGDDGDDGDDGFPTMPEPGSDTGSAGGDDT